MATDSGSYDDATLQRRAAMAQAMMGPRKQPITHWAEGLAELGNGFLGGYELAKVDKERKAEKAAEKAEIYGLLGAPVPAPKPQEPGGFERIGSMLGMGGTPAPAQAAQPQPSAPPAATGDVSPYSRAIAGIESGGAYDKLGPETKGDRAYGKYQVMGANIPEWTQAALGKSMTPQEFLASPDAQEAVFKHRFGQYVDKYGPEGAAKAWFAGEKGMNNPNARDVLGTSVSAYADKFNRGLGQQPYQVAGPPTAAPQGAPQVPPVVAAMSGGAPAPAGGLLADVPADRKAQIAAMMTSSNPTVKALGLQMLGNYTKADQPTDEIREFQYGQKNPAFIEYQTNKKKAGATNVNVDTKGENAFAAEAGKAQAKRYDEIAGEGQTAKQMVSDVQTLSELGKTIGTGKGAEAKAALGPYAEALGIKIDGLNEIQAFEAIVNRVAPSLRVKGSGAQSDYELKNFLKSLPNLGNTPEGNAIAAKTIEGLYNNKIAASEIASKALAREITPAQADKMIRELPDPMADYRELLKKNRESGLAKKPAAAPAGVDPGALEEARRRGLIK